MMGDRREDYTNLSLMLSRVMDDVGVNEECVLRRRRVNLVRENIETIGSRTRRHNVTVHIFGSQTEGTTTDGLNSDTDELFVMDKFNVIQDWKDWEPGKHNYLMIRDEVRYPGYCKLQMLRDDVPLPDRTAVPPGDVQFVNDGDGNVIRKGMYINEAIRNAVRHGPAATFCQGDAEYDNVPAYKCHTWPKHFGHWTQNERGRDWPTPEMIHYMKSTGCLVVKAIHRLDDRDETWRISTSLAERCLMFSLNITQIRCYVLLKMIVKTFISPYLPDTISSYMCKTLLFHCIENTRKEFWKEHNLLQCVHQVLLYMIAAVLDENCPNYFNKSANLFLGIVDNRKKVDLSQRIRLVIKSKCRFLMEINFDQVNTRLKRQLLGINLRSFQNDVADKRKMQHKKLIDSFFLSLRINVLLIRGKNRCKNEVVLTVSRDLIQMGHIQYQSVRLFLPFVCSYIASIEASKSILQGSEPTATCLKLYDISLNSDVTSSRLKFASYLYCTGQLERTLSVLHDVEERIDDSVMMMCGCHGLIDPKYPARFGEQEASQPYPTTNSLALCVMFSKAESQCCPRELRYDEMFRSTDEERRNRDEVSDNWMRLAVMDALPYLYYLQYMTYRHLGRREQQYNVLHKLDHYVCTNEYQPHRETALNVLGQCMEYENKPWYAIICYSASLRRRSENNAVRWLIALLMFRLTQGRIHV